MPLQNLKIWLDTVLHGSGQFAIDPKGKPWDEAVVLVSCQVHDEVVTLSYKGGYPVQELTMEISGWEDVREVSHSWGPAIELTGDLQISVWQSRSWFWGLVSGWPKHLYSEKTKSLVFARQS